MLDYSRLPDHGNEFVERMEALVHRTHAATSLERDEARAARAYLRDEAAAYHSTQERLLAEDRATDTGLLTREHRLARADARALVEEVAGDPVDLLEHRGELARYVGRVRWLLGAAR